MARGHGGGAGAAVHHQRAGAVGADRAGRVVGAGDAGHEVGPGALGDVDLHDRGQPVTQRDRDRAAGQHERAVGGHAQAVAAQVAAETLREQAQALRGDGVHGAGERGVGGGLGVGGIGRVGVLVGRLGDGGVLEHEEVGGVGAEVGVPVAHGRVGVQDRGDLLLLALLARLGVGLLGVVGVLGHRHQRGHDEHAAVAPGQDGLDAAGTRDDQPGLAARGRDHPERGDRVVSVGVRVGAGRDEVQVALGVEGRTRLALGRTGDAARGRLAGRVELPDRVGVAGLLGVQRRDDRGQPLAVGTQRQPVHARVRDEVLQVVERGLRASSTHAAHPAARVKPAAGVAARRGTRTRPASPTRRPCPR